jgi:hypothetical protein
MTLDYSQTAADAPLINDERLQRVLDMLAAHLQENEGPVSPFMEFVLELVTIQFGIGIVIPDELRHGAGRDGEREADAFGIARGIIARPAPRNAAPRGGRGGQHRNQVSNMTYDSYGYGPDVTGGGEDEKLSGADFNDFGYGPEVTGIAPGSAQEQEAALAQAGFGGLLYNLTVAHEGGQCLHGDVTGYRVTPERPEQVGLAPGQLRCLGGCERIFASGQDWVEALAAIANGGPEGAGQ